MILTLLYTEVQSKDVVVQMNTIVQILTISANQLLKILIVAKKASNIVRLKEFVSQMIGNAVVQATLIAPPNTLNVPLPKNVVRTLQRNGVYIRTNVLTSMIFVATQMKQYVTSMENPHAGQILIAVSMENSGAPMPLMKLVAQEIADLIQINVVMKLMD